MRRVARVTLWCEVCATSFERRPCELRGGRGRYCSTLCSHMALNSERWRRHHAEIADRFWLYVSRSEEHDACWPWIGKNKYRRGYGRFILRGKQISAHRFALEITEGPPPPDRPFALHSCDNPPCCNPNHLRWGTPKNNTDDMWERGRGGQEYRRKFDHDEAAQLHADGCSYSVLAAKYRVNQSNIGKAIKRSILRAKLAEDGR